MWSGVATGDYEYSYDENFFLTSMTLSSGSDTVVTSFTRDEDGMPTGYGPFTLTRNGPAGSLSQIDDGDMTVTIGYDTLANVQNHNLTVNGNSVYDFALTRNNVGRIEQKVETINGVNHRYDYSYDADGRLINVTRDTSTMVESYSYDANGNRLSALAATATYDTQDRIRGQGAISYTFDDDGFLVQRGSDTFQYSARGELLSVTLDGGPEVITYDYDGLHRRVGRSDISGTTQYLYGNPDNPFQLTAVRDTGGLLTTLYYDGEGLLFAMNQDGSMYYVGTDQVGTPHVVTDTDGTVVKVLEYDSFGVLLSDSNPSFILPIGFGGGLEDSATGLLRFGYRDYNQASGRWTARDPVLYDGGQINLYVYAGNDPVGQRDPTGLWCVGGSLYVGVGAGAQLCCSGGKCSICVEGGVGLGGSWGAGSGDAKETGNSGVADISAGCGPVGAGANCAYGFKCGLDCDLEGNFGPMGYSAKSGKKASAGGGSGAEAGIGRCSAQAKLALEGCGQW
jgi:RHS repeat-associated protein